MATKKKPQGKSKTWPLLLDVPYHEDRETFIGTAMSQAQKAARQLHKDISKKPQKKGGRPTKQTLIWSTCREIVERQKGKLPSNNQTKAWLMEQVKQRTKTTDPKDDKGKYLNHRTLKKHVGFYLTYGAPFTALPIRARIKIYQDPKIFSRHFQDMASAMEKHFPQDPSFVSPVKQLRETARALDAILDDPVKLTAYKKILPTLVKEFGKLY